MQNFYYTIDLKDLSTVTLYTKVNCAEYNELQWWASAVFELTSEIPDSDFHFDFVDYNIFLNSKYFNMIYVKLQVPIALHCVTSLHNSY